jgi:hypothetical protein
MHGFEIFFLLLILAAFGGFAVVLAWLNANYTRWRDGDRDHPARPHA